MLVKYEANLKRSLIESAVAIQHSYGLTQRAEALSDGPVMFDRNTHLLNGARKIKLYGPAIQKNNQTMSNISSKANDSMDLCPPNNDPSFIILWSNFKPFKSGFNHSLGYNQIDDLQKQIIYSSLPRWCQD